MYEPGDIICIKNRFARKFCQCGCSDELIGRRSLYVRIENRRYTRGDWVQPIYAVRVGDYTVDVLQTEILQ